MEKNRIEFDIMSCPLNGVRLIEASAGSGKTFCISHLYLRLLFGNESFKALEVPEILVVTFTEAATEELKLRIRAILHESWLYASGAFRPENGKKEQHHRIIDSVGDMKKALLLINKALLSFDEAAIFTIHGFCARMLNENAFESSLLFDAELSENKDEFFRELAEDFWRHEFYGTSPLADIVAETGVISISSLVHLAEKISIRLNPESSRDEAGLLKIESPDGNFSSEDIKESFMAIHKEWMENSAAIRRFLSDNKGKFKKGEYNLPENIENYMLKFSECLGREAFTPGTLYLINIFSRETIKNELRKKSGDMEFPEEVSEFIDICQSFTDKNFPEKIAASSKLKFIEFLRTESQARKSRRNIQDFDDLLTNLRNSLYGKNGDSLAGKIRSRFKAALIDEFQDTDPVQYGIFRKVFAGENSTLYLVGDPKQSIYAFRNGDIFTYSDARKDAQKPYLSLLKNWRSEPGLVKAVNTLFYDENGKSFVSDFINYENIAPSGGANSKHMVVEGEESDAPFRLWFQHGEEEAGGKLTKSAAAVEETIYKNVPLEILHLLENGKIGSDKVRPSDIAILVRRHEQARKMRESLAHYGIPSVLQSSGNIFDSREAVQLCQIMSAVAEPGNHFNLRAALSLEFFGLDAKKIFSFVNANAQEDINEYEQWVSKFTGYNKIWAGRSFIEMFGELIIQNSLRKKIVTLPEGERRLTNFLHLSEILHKISTEKKLGVSGLLSWLRKQLDSERRDDNEEYELRLESDENAVQMLTVFKSKGLQFPIVFCPFMWENFVSSKRGRKGKDFIVFHQEYDGASRMVIDIGSRNYENNRLMAEDEIFAESMRLLYVSLTRAKNRVYLYWGAFSSPETSPIAYLLHRGKELRPNGNLTSVVGEIMKNKTVEQMRKDIEQFIERSDGAICLAEFPEKTEEMKKYSVQENLSLVENLPESPYINGSWGIANFSNLAPHIHDKTEFYGNEYFDDEPEDDNDTKKTDQAGFDIFSFPAGKKTGDCLHRIFEKIGFDENYDSIKNSVNEIMENYGLDYPDREVRRKIILGMVKNVLETPLITGSNSFILRKIGKKDRLSELKFHFPLRFDGMRIDKIRETLKEFSKHENCGYLYCDILKNWNSAITHGFMNGAIDLIFRYKNKFYIIDWKSNRINGRPEDFFREGLEKEISKNFYHLQFLIYSVALHKYLKRQLGDSYSYSEHFGGVFYIFLRGVNGNPDSGIFRTIPQVELVEKLAEIISGEDK